MCIAGSNVVINMWSQIEIAASITCACLPPLKPLFCMVFKGFLGDCDEKCGGTTPRPRQLQSPHDDSVLQGSFVETGSEEGLTQVGTGLTMQREKDIESGATEKTGDVTVHGEYDIRAEV